MAMFYSTCLLVMNLYYYWTNLEGLQLALGIFLSIIIPVSIFNIAEEVAEDYNKSKEVENSPSEWDTKASEFRAEFEGQLDSIRTTLNVLSSVRVGRKKKTIPTPEALMKKGGSNE